MKGITVNTKNKSYNLKSRLGEINGLDFKHQFSNDPELAFLTYIDSINKQPVMRIFKVENNKLYDYAITPIKMFRYTGDLKEVFDKQKALLKETNGSWKHFGKTSIQNRIKKIDAYYLDQVDEILNIKIEEINNHIFSDLTGIEDFNLKYLPDRNSQYKSIFEQEARRAKNCNLNDMDLHYMYLNANLETFKETFSKEYMSLDFNVFNNNFIDFSNYLYGIDYNYKEKSIVKVLNHSFEPKEIAEMVIEICDDNSDIMIADETFNSAIFNILYLNKMFDDENLLIEILNEYLYDIILHEVDMRYLLQNILTSTGAKRRLIEVLDPKIQEQAYFYVIQNIMKNIIGWGDGVVGDLMEHIYHLLVDRNTKEEKEVKDIQEFPDLKTYIDYYLPPELKE